MRQTKIHVGLILLGQNVEQGRNREKKRKKRKKREKKWEKTKIRYGIKCILMSRVFGMNFPWRLVPYFSRVLWRDHPNPRIVEFMWVKS